MRKENSGSQLTADSAFSMDRLNNADNFEKGLSATLGFDYELAKDDKNFMKFL